MNSAKFKWIRGELLSKASYGRVYLALNASTGEMIIVKQIKRPINNTDLDIESQTRLNAALNREIDMIKDISHINIVQYLGLEQTPKYMSISGHSRQSIRTWRRSFTFHARRWYTRVRSW